MGKGGVRVGSQVVCQSLPAYQKLASGWEVGAVVLGLTMRLVKSGLTGLAALLLAAVVSPAAAQKLTITGVPPAKSLQFFAGTGWEIFLDGEIDAEADKRFAEFLNANGPDQYSTVILNSPGGSPITAMKIGRMIRQRGFSVNIGKRGGSSDSMVTYGNGQCYSACSLAYLGGRFRWMSDSARYGVHRFWFSEPVKDSVDIAQILSAAISTYVHEMGVSPQFNEVFVSAGKSEMTEPTRDELARLRVTNNGFERTTWTVESQGGFNYIKGERDTVYGINKFILGCPAPRSFFLHMIMDPQGRQEEVMGMRAHTLVIDDKNHALKPVRREIKNAWFNGSYELTLAQARAIGRAGSVGVMLQHSREAPMFLGFNSMEIEQGAGRLRSFLQSCGA